MKTTVSEKGQITIPKAVRERVGIEPGHVLDVHEERGRVVLTKHVPEDAFEAVYGILEPGGPTNQRIEDLRGVADAVELK